ncbi:Wzz/FepE/Etk N-terminal domain-containing protein [Gordonia sp. 852002-51296_SCH5728562-b]|uniref:Wzz/FepE/Etk N-terminal domain-containing protein n=1 Tax=Gordonia sp. 852002-51296_SCH5728562-b TaxID=1834101 RepID=UPI0009EEA7DC|nr:Wzz/FepE/Etk N-terminal domain-containing protein [Gordonia sp. 852002-51296_SCH5728562-b]
MDFRKLFRRTRLRQLWWVVVLAAVIGVCCGAIIGKVVPKEYTATSQLFISASGGTSSTEAYQNDQFSQQRAISYAQLITSEKVADRVIDRLGLQTTPAELMNSVSATTIPRTVLVNVSVKNSNPRVAVQIANTVSSEFIGYVRQLETPAGQSQPRSMVTQVSKADESAVSSFPNTVNCILYGLLAGLVVGVIAAASWGYWTGRNKSREELAEAAGTRAYGTFDVYPMDSLDSIHQTTWFDGYRRLRAQVEASGETRPRVIVVTSSSARDDQAASLIVTRFALAYGAAVAETGRGATVIDLVGGSATDGRPDFAVGMQQGSAADTLVVDTGLDSLTLAVSERGAGEIAATSAMRDFVSQRVEDGAVVIAAPSALRSSVAAVLGELADAVLVLAAAGTPLGSDHRDAVDIVRDAGVENVASVLVVDRGAVTSVSDELSVSASAAAVEADTGPAADVEPVKSELPGAVDGPVDDGREPESEVEDDVHEVYDADEPESEPEVYDADESENEVEGAAEESGSASDGDAPTEDRAAALAGVGEQNREWRGARDAAPQRFLRTRSVRDWQSRVTNDSL